ncbi:gamma-aminobutyric acid type B receptor subunit 2-like [Lytechinus variegatus]|uniref:gamma-aminobutyric acid type B receptor subunit 2-like n=1 Tax=Lytechinus variegatus TaxID=7654 RepID=UPI001BB1C45E|nr:gamma-aminobutyric acid type B receptor subunit 2-like [Lytechinus variegatus]
MMVIGGLRNEITEAVSKPLVFWGVVQITYGSHAPSLSSGNPLLFRTIPSTNSYNDPRIKMCMKWEWKNVGILGVNSLDNIAVVNDLITKLDESNIHVMVKEAFNVDKDMETMSQNIAQSLKYLKDKDVRVIIGNFYQKEAIQVFCEAYKAELYGSNYVWLIWGHYEHEWWKMDDETTDCTMEEISAAVEGYIAVTFDVLGDSNNETISKMTASEYSEVMLRQTGVDFTRETKPGPFAYDAVWASALAMNASLEDMPYSLGQFSYGEIGRNMSKVFSNKLWEMQFLGLSGPVVFSENGDRIGVLRINRNINGTVRDIGRYYKSDDRIEWYMPMESIWASNGGTPPKDADSHQIVTEQVSRELFISMLTFSIIGIVIAICFLVFNIFYRDEKLIKMSSPNMNNIIIGGCILTYITAIILGVDIGLLDQNGLKVMCQARTWIFSIGFTLSFGAMFSKTWRVYSIFTNKKLQKRVIKDYRLFAMVGILLLIDIIVLMVWQIIDPLQVQVKIIEVRADPDRPNLIFKTEQHTCDSKFEQYFIWTLFIYKGLLLIFGTFITWQTRNVSIPALNDSRYIGVSIYTVVIFSALGVPLSFLLAENSSYSYAIIAGLILFCTTLTLALLFLPKVFSIIHGYAPEEVGSRVMSNVNGRPAYSSGFRNGPGGSRSQKKSTLLAAETSQTAADRERTSEAQIAV